MTTEME